MHTPFLLSCLASLSAARATGSTIRAEKLKFNASGANPEIELDINGANVFEVYYNRSVSKVELQVGRALVSVSRAPLTVLWFNPCSCMIRLLRAAPHKSSLLSRHLLGKCEGG